MNWEVRTMRSVTSYFNSTLYRKAMSRYWPLWVFFGGIWLFVIPLNLLNLGMNYGRYGYGATEYASWIAKQARNIPMNSLGMGVGLTMFYAVLCAMAVFGYLYNSRSACMMHALPPRREALFLSHYLAGLSFLVLPLVSVALITLAVDLVLVPGAMLGLALRSLALWLGVQCGAALFFFSFAAFCAMFTGHILALPAFYGILNGLVVGMYELVSLLLACFTYGFSGASAPGRWVELCTPVYALCSAVAAPEMNGVRHLRQPMVVVGYAVVGVVLAALALMVYRSRRIESAGDVVSVPLVRPVFRWGVALCTGMSFGTFLAAFFGWYDQAVPLTLCVLLCAAVGWFIAEMLLRKSFHVLSAWKGCVVLCTVLVMLCAAFFLDLFGIETRVPQADQVQSVRLSGNLSSPYDSGNPAGIEITDPDQIREIIALHQAVVNDRARAQRTHIADASVSYLELVYTLPDGDRLVRVYDSLPLFQDEADQEGSITYAVNQIIQDRNLMKLFYGLDDHDNDTLEEAVLSEVRNTKTDSLEDLILDEDTGAKLWQAVRQDYQEGTIGVRYLIEDDDRMNNTYRTDLRFIFTRMLPQDKDYGDEGRYQSYDITVTLTPQATHTAQVLEESGLLGDVYVLQPHTQEDFMETADWEDDTPQTESVVTEALG